MSKTHLLIVWLAGIFCLVPSLMLATESDAAVPEKPLALTFEVLASNTPLFLAAGPCSVNRICDYPPWPTISCSSSSPNGSCTSGPDNNGWVECDGQRTYCPSCPLTCTAHFHCNSYCTSNAPSGASTLTVCHAGCCACYYSTD